MTNQAERDGELLQNAAQAINSGKAEKKEDVRAVKAKDKQKSLLEKWVEFVNQNNLAFQTSDGTYLKVEAWNFLFSLLKVTPTILDMSRQVHEEEDVTYVAKAALMPMSKELPEVAPLGTTAFGACTIGESDYCRNDFSALSMAQTRAIGKLGRTAYAHLAIACGFKATPFEEIKLEKDKA